MENGFWSMDGDRTKPFSGLAKAVVFFILVLFLIVAATGCANVTIVKLAELCHAHDGKPSVTFSGESGKADCK